MLKQAAIKTNETAPAVALAGQRERVALTRLVLTDFRSYAGADLAFDGRPVAIFGANGAGKTNILEAISLVGPGRGLRRARLDELPRLGGPGGWSVAIRIKDEDDEQRFGVGVDADRPERRICRIDGAPASGPGAFADRLRFMWLTPAQDRLFMDGASERRRFLDRMALAHDPAHAKASADYENAMRSRQRLLDEGRSDDSWLAGLERQMAEAGVAIAAARCAMVSRLAHAEIAASGGIFPAADLALDGGLEAALADVLPAAVEDAFAEELAEARRRDAAAGRALSGPHRTDLLVAHRAKKQPARLCSTGEQKALLIGLVLAASRAFAKEFGARPPLILLLDEVAAHLDPDRRAALYDIIDELGFQAFLTGTDEALFSAWGSRAQRFAARDGALTAID
ncbi:MAG: DNA replication/repair protein RecF [Pseudomonadota bacterium]